MDRFTRQTKIWLETRRFNGVDQFGNYIPHQPIYGFEKCRKKPGIIVMYLITYQIMKILSRLNFDSLVDVGGGEGYTAALVKKLFGAKVVNSDLSEEACKRAEEIYGLRSTPADIHQLPFKDEEFDVVLCSETLEHVKDTKKAAKELIRISKKAVIVSVPHEFPKMIEGDRKTEIHHTHINAFDIKSFEYLKDEGYSIFSQKIMTPSLRWLGLLFEAIPFDLSSAKKGKITFREIMLRLYNFATPVLRKFFGKWSVVLILLLDELFCRLTTGYGGIIFVIVKDTQSWRKKVKGVSIRQIVNFQVPFLRLCSNNYIYK